MTNNEPPIIYPEHEANERVMWISQNYRREFVQPKPDNLEFYSLDSLHKWFDHYAMSTMDVNAKVAIFVGNREAVLRVVSDEGLFIDKACLSMPLHSSLLFAQNHSHIRRYTQEEVGDRLEVVSHMEELATDEDRKKLLGVTHFLKGKIFKHDKEACRLPYVVRRRPEGMAYFGFYTEEVQALFREAKARKIKEIEDKFKDYMAKEKNPLLVLDASIIE